MAEAEKTATKPEPITHILTVTITGARVRIQHEALDLDVEGGGYAEALEMLGLLAKASLDKLAPAEPYLPARNRGHRRLAELRSLVNSLGLGDASTGAPRVGGAK